MAEYPSPSDYQEALQFPTTMFLDPELAAGTPATNALGLPQPITGAFAAVFPVITADGRYAVRCFLTRVEGQAARYRAVARHLAKAKLESTVAFDYQSEGIRVSGKTYPVLKMAWAEGEGLAAFVERHLRDPETLRALAEAWRTLLAELNAVGIAHGDLQHGNVLVSEENGRVRFVLVDYDAMFVPALAGLTSAEVGHRNYQHPDRTESDFDASLDHFPGLVVYTALRALEERPDLWAEFSTGENLLFQAGDFYDPSSSPLFAALREIEPVRPLAEALATACYLEPGAVPSLEEVLSGDVPGSPSRKSRGAKRPARYGWRTARSRFETWALPAFVVTVVILAWVGLAMGWEVAAVAGIVAATVEAWAVRRGYGAQSIVRRRRRTERERRDFLDRLDAFRAERLKEVQADALERHLRHHFTGELDSVEGVGHRAVVRLKAVGIRNAFHATPERVAEARGLSSETRRLVGAWRRGLAAEADDDVPGKLSPAEEQRLNRQIERRLQSLDAEAARIEAKADVQRVELARVREQHESLPVFAPWRYVLFLLRLRSLPQTEPASRAPILQRPAESRTVSPSQPATAETSDAAWWEQA